MSDTDLDSLLESALEDFSLDAPRERVPPPVPRSTPSVAHHAPSSPSSNPFAGGNPEMAGFTSLMQNLMGNDVKEDDLMKEMESLIANIPEDGMQDLLQNFQGFVQQMMREEEAQGGQGPATTSTGSTESKSMEEVLNQMLEQSKDVAGVEQMMKEMTDDPEMGKLMEFMMQKFMSKEIMYDSMKLLREQLDEWLQKNRQRISPEDLKRYNLQLETVERVLALYNDCDQPNPVELQRLIDEFSNLGELPEELVQGLVPGFNL